MKWFIRSLAVASLPLSIAGQTAAQQVPIPDQPPLIEEAPVPQAEALGGVQEYFPAPDFQSVPAQDVTPAFPVPGYEPLSPPPIPGIHPQPLYCPQPMHGLVPVGCPGTPLYPTSGLCCLNPVQTTSAWCPPPIMPSAPWCPPAPAELPVATTAIPPLPAYTGVVAGYPFSTAPVYSNSCATRHSFHPLRKDAFWHASPGNMFPMQPIAPVAKGTYYFRPYNFRQVHIDQMHAALWTGNTREPYTSPLLPELSAKLHHYKASLDKALLPTLGSPVPAAPGTLAPMAPAAPAAPAAP
ncbi:MAG: hypothetical protein RL215_480 [Planctomycetota bacterium]